MSEPYTVGDHVSTDHLIVEILPVGRRFLVANDAAGWTELIASRRPFAIVTVGLEPTGGYERGVVRAPLAAGQSVRRINPAKLRQFAAPMGCWPRTIAWMPA